MGLNSVLVSSSLFFSDSVVCLLLFTTLTILSLLTLLTSPSSFLSQNQHHPSLSTIHPPFLSGTKSTSSYHLNPPFSIVTRNKITIVISLTKSSIPLSPGTKWQQSQCRDNQPGSQQLQEQVERRLEENLDFVKIWILSKFGFCWNIDFVKI